MSRLSATPRFNGRETTNVVRATADFTVSNHGSIFLVLPQTAAASDWLRETAPEDAQYFGRALVVEPRYVLDVVNAAREAGLEVA